ncbi:MAG TPA: AAC(3) family N-acetyltransferase [Anaerolineaceae bacterium]|nr:AAC(3) family N-acetyltransferase [Anaerolineaceae bacterium]
MTAYRDLISAFRRLGIDRSRPVLVHASLSTFGEVRGGAETLVGALLASWDTLLAPAFTYKTMLIPETGPEDNGILYGSGADLNKMAEFFTADMPVDPLMGIVPETIRRQPRAGRSSHPILSMTGIHAAPILETQTLAEPLAPIGALLERDGWVLLLGVDHTVNTSIHYGEKLVGRKQFTRWALTPEGVRECPGFPGCSDGFQAIAPRLEGQAREIQVCDARVTAVALSVLIPAVQAAIAADPLALLCERGICPRCGAVRKEVEREQRAA